MVNKDYVANDADTAIVWPLNAITLYGSSN